MNGIASPFPCPDGITLSGFDHEVDPFRTETFAWRAAARDACDRLATAA